ncbi:cbb3-type cytochrome oxidase assembly protein CcoS [Shinella zoogloeoides]|uniref:cbb3-type cytochrome oxidase assembly protein CcoS n=1 Tax=Shinella zoogloeoides TaxID=352475 RepID=UPI00273EA136|nr:cbb3-type cytochrome oxidase assembly protein CcoS [Shinella zoogloeoides]WLR91315.1 cbb3-type cytochrome oxidase assembly protein CcoS [Shinella zoogloeoides]
MTAIGLLVPLSIIMGIAGLLAFLWSLRARQYEDLDGAAARILLENDEDAPVVDRQRNLAGEGDSDGR